MPGAESRIGVITADDHPVYLAELSAAVRSRPDLELLATATDGAAALELIREYRPAVAVLEVLLPLTDGLAVLGAVRRESPATRVLMLTRHEDDATAYRVIAAGGAGYLKKRHDAERICNAIAAVASGEVVIDDELQGGIAREIQRRENTEVPKLTPREIEVLQHAASGLSVSGLAAALVVSEATIKTHLHRAYSKLGVSDRAAAVARAIRFGLIG